MGLFHTEESTWPPTLAISSLKIGFTRRMIWSRSTQTIFTDSNSTQHDPRFKFSSNKLPADLSDYYSDKTLDTLDQTTLPLEQLKDSLTHNLINTVQTSPKFVKENNNTSLFSKLS